MKIIKGIITTCAILFLFKGVVLAQDPLSYLRTQCPKLTEMYQDELINCHAHYVIAVDVSLSMRKFEENVLPALKSFVQALPEGDKFTLIPFAGEPEDNRMGYDVEITNSTKSSMLQLLPSLYPQGAVPKGSPYLDTDIFKAQQSVMKSVQTNAQYEVNVIIFISDMMHCPNNNIDRQFTGDEVNSMSTLLKSAKNNSEVRLFTLQLPKSGQPEGYVLPKMKELYQDNWNAKLEEVEVPANSGALIEQWFNKQKDMIMFTKLQAIIFKENQANPIKAETVIDIDGNVTANIEWTAGKLYPKITIDSTYVDEGSDFRLKCNQDYVKYSAVGELNVQEIELGKVKHSSWGFHKMADTLHFDVKLPVEYQNEVDKLLEGRPGPMANATEYKERLVWTFIFPLWLSCLIAAAILLYIILVIKTVAKNSKVAFSGKVVVTLIDEEEDVVSKKVNNLKNFSIGAGGSNGLAVPGSWSVAVKKITPSPFKLKNAYFECVKGAGFISVNGKPLSSQNSSFNDKCTGKKFYGGLDKNTLTHKISIQYYPNSK